MEHDRCSGCGRWHEEDTEAFDEALRSEDVVWAMQRIAADIDRKRRAFVFGDRTRDRARRCHRRER